MKLFRRTNSLAVVAMLAMLAPVLAQQSSAGMMEKGHQMGGMTQPQGMQGMGMMEMQKKMQELHQHSKMMEGMKDQHQLMEEMKKHMRMMDEMMEGMMMQRHQEMTAPGQEPEHQQHPPSKSQ